MTTVKSCWSGRRSIASRLHDVSGVALHVSAVARARAWKHVCGVGVGDWDCQHRASSDRTQGQRFAMADMVRVGAGNGWWHA